MIAKAGPADSKPRGGSEVDYARLVGRLSGDYILRSLLLIASLQGGDIVAAIIAQAIGAANIGHLEQTGEGAQFAGMGETPPDAVRRPISVLALAGTLGLPFETTRRYVNKLAAAGVVERVKGGVIVPSRAIADDRVQEVVAANLVNVRRFFRSLKKAGVPLD